MNCPSFIHGTVKLNVYFISFRFLFHLAVLQLNILFTFGHKKIVDFLQQTERERGGWDSRTVGRVVGCEHNNR